MEVTKYILILQILTFIGVATMMKFDGQCSTKDNLAICDNMCAKRKETCVGIDIKPNGQLNCLCSDMVELKAILFYQPAQLCTLKRVEYE